VTANDRVLTELVVLGMPQLQEAAAKWMAGEVEYAWIVQQTAFINAVCRGEVKDVSAPPCGICRKPVINEDVERFVVVVMAQLERQHVQPLHAACHGDHDGPAVLKMIIDAMNRFAMSLGEPPATVLNSANVHETGGTA
jgi:hypothetical protein